MIENGDIFLTSWNDETGTNYMMRLNSSLSLIYYDAPASTSFLLFQSQTRYWSLTERVYVLDVDTRWINAFAIDNNTYTRDSTQSFTIPAPYKPTSIAFYVTSTGIELIYIATGQSILFVYVQSNKTLIYTSGTICDVDYMNDLFIDQYSGYLIFSCSYDNKLKLWTTDGTTHTNTGQFISGISEPTCMDFDSYGRFVVAGTLEATNKVHIFDPPDHPYPV